MSALLSSACLDPGEAPPEDDVAPVEVATNAPGFAAWKESVRFNHEADVYAIGGPVSPLGLVGDEEARAYYDRYVAKGQALTLHNGQENPGDEWLINGSSFAQGATLKLCVDRAALRTVAERHPDLAPGTDLFPMVQEAVLNAASVWRQITGLDIQYAADREESCSPRAEDDITWYVKPLFIPSGEKVEYLSFVLRPHHNALGPDKRNMYVYEEIITEATYPDSFFGPLFTLEGLYLNLIGTGLGFIPEQNRIDKENGQEAYWPAACRQPDVGGIFLSRPDPYSVMTHPQSMAEDFLAQPECAGARPFDYAVTYLDAMGAACLYRKEHGLYYCSDAMQAELMRRAQGPNCSPYPIVEGESDCGTPLNWDAPAAQYEAALIHASQASRGRAR